MKKLLIKILSFTIGLVVYFGINAFINYNIISKTNPNIGKSKILIVGDSHPQKSINPQYFKSAQNISQPMEPLILTYWKLKRVLSIAKPDIIIIGLAPHNISAFNDLKFSKKKWASEMFIRSYTIQNFKKIKSIDIDYKKYYNVLWKENCFYPKTDHFKFIGNYLNSDFSDISDSNSAIERHYYYNNKLLGESEIAITYVDSIIQICDLNRKIPIFVSSPVHKSYYKLIPSQVKVKYEELKKRLNSREIVFIDKTTDYYPDSLYLNSDHLNKKGANRFTLEIKEIIASKVQL